MFLVLLHGSSMHIVLKDEKFVFKIFHQNVIFSAAKMKYNIQYIIL